MQRSTFTVPLETCLHHESLKRCLILNNLPFHKSIFITSDRLRGSGSCYRGLSINLMPFLCFPKAAYIFMTRGSNFCLILASLQAHCFSVVSGD